MAISNRTVTPSPVVRLVHRDQNQIRRRLLHRLGISASANRAGLVTSSSVPYDQTSRFPASVRRQPLSQQRPVEPSTNDPIATNKYQVPLKFDSTSKSNRERRSVVRWSTDVSVVEIPSHQDYDETTRRQIWTSLSEIAEEAERNRMEFITDGCDYLKATEENRMINWQGELVHPATYWILYEQDQQRLLHESLAQEISDATNGLDCGLGLANSGGAGGIKRSPTMSSLAALTA